MKKRTLFSVLLIGLTALLIGSSVYAYFSDVETASSNNFTAGTLDLQVGDADPCTETINITNLTPGDSGTADFWLVQNTGTIAGDLNISVGTVANDENTRYEMETDAGDAPGETGELGANLKVAFWMDVGSGGAWSSGDYYLKSDETKVSWASGETLPSEAYDVVDNYSGDEWAEVQTELTGTIGTFKVAYDLPSDTSNVVQSDGCTFDITFTLMQA